ncbi:MAG: HAMP domain-containing histidine kinase, partial [Alphaproteobacteria bacterium]|nr:HAMP domain-containing histidine kinase [Alphaproteobacteria bacterium]
MAVVCLLWVSQPHTTITPASWLYMTMPAALLLQPILFRLTGGYNLLSMISITILNAMILVAAYNFGGHLSPVLPVSIIIPVFCLLFMPPLGQIVGLTTLTACYGVLIGLYVNGHAFPQFIAQEQLSGFFMAGVIVAALLATAMARAYLDLYALSRNILHEEIARHRDTADNLAKARHQMQHAAKAKRQSLATVCDDIRVPLNAVIGFAQIISRELMGRLSDERYRTCASDIESSGRHMLGIIDEVLDLVRVESGDLELTESEFELAHLISKVSDTVAGMAQARDVELSRDLPSEGIMVFADHGRVRQVIIALLSNCIALVGGGGRIHIQLSKTTADDVMLLIRTTGSTVSPERMALALQPFDGITTEHGAERLGIGYGLPIARRLIELHGGKLEVSGPAQDEAHVILTLPAERLL